MLPIAIVSIALAAPKKGLDITDELLLGATNLPSMLNGTIRLLSASINSMLSSTMKEKDFRFSIDSVALANISFTPRSSWLVVGTGDGVLVGLGVGVGGSVGVGMGLWGTFKTGTVSFADVDWFLSSSLLLQADVICIQSNNDNNKNKLMYLDPKCIIVPLGFTKWNMVFVMFENYVTLVPI